MSDVLGIQHRSTSVENGLQELSPVPISNLIVKSALLYLVVLEATEVTKGVK